MKPHLIAIAFVSLVAFLIGLFAFVAYQGAYTGAYDAFSDFIEE